MKAQLRPVGLVVSRCQNVGIGVRQNLRWTQITAQRDFSSVTRAIHPKPTPLVQPSCQRKLGNINQVPVHQSIGRTLFSTSSTRRLDEGEAKGPGEAREGGTQEAAPAGGKPVYPERLIIYHAGTSKTTFLACLKLTTIFVFGFFDMIMTPAYLAAGEPALKTAGVALCGIIPAAYVAWTTSPFVAAVHLHLPPYARWSRSILERFARTAPPNTRLDVTTMSLIGKPRVSSMVLSDLRPAPPESLGRRLGTVSHVRDTSLLDARRKWWRFRAVGQFNVQDGVESTLKTGWVWKEIRDGIAKRAGMQGQTKQ